MQKLTVNLILQNPHFTVVFEIGRVVIGHSFRYSHSNVLKKQKKQNTSRQFYFERSTLSGTREFTMSYFRRKNTMYVLIFLKTLYLNFLKSTHTVSTLTNRRQGIVSSAITIQWIWVQD